MSLRTLPFNINFQSGLELHCEVVFPDGDLLEPAFYQCFVEFSKVSALLLDVVLQIVNSCNLRVSGSGVNGAFFTLFAELENLVGYLVVGFLVVSLFEKLLLEFHQLFVNSISGGFPSVSDDLGNVLLQLCLIGRFIAKERVNGLNYHIL